MTNKEFSRIISEHFNIIYYLLNQYVDPAWHADAQQNILIRLWKALPTFKGECKLSTFIYKIALRETIDWRRRERVKMRTLENYQQRQSTHGENICYIDDTKRLHEYERLVTQLKDLCDEWLTTLTDIDRTIFKERYYNRKRVNVLAAEIGYNANHIQQKLYRLREKFRNKCLQNQIK